MSKTIVLAAEFIAEDATGKLRDTLKLREFIKEQVVRQAGGFVVMESLFYELNGVGTLSLSANICEASHALLLENEELFMETVFGHNFSANHDVVSFSVSDEEESVMKLRLNLLSETKY